MAFFSPSPPNSIRRANEISRKSVVPGIFHARCCGPAAIYQDGGGRVQPGCKPFGRDGQRNFIFSGHFSPSPPSNIRRADEFWREGGWEGCPENFFIEKYFFLFFCVFGRKPGLRRYKSIRRGRKFFLRYFHFSTEFRQFSRVQNAFPYRGRIFLE